MNQPISCGIDILLQTPGLLDTKDIPHQQGKLKNFLSVPEWKTSVAGFLLYD